jgi:hypothetical protein
MERLGKDYDLVACIVPKDLQDNAHNIGVRVSLKDCEGVDFVLYKGAGTNGQDPVVDIQQANAASGGTAKDLNCIAHFYTKKEASLDGDELWVETTQTVASEITVDSDLAEVECIQVYHVNASDLDFAGGFYWAFVYIADVGANAQLGCVLAIRTGLNVQRKPSNLRNPNA